MSLLKREVLILLGWIGAGAVIVVVFGLIVVPWVWSLGASPQQAQTPTGPDPLLNLASPSGPILCTGAGAPIAGCLSSGDYVYEVPFGECTVDLGDAYFHVLNATGANYSAQFDGGFTILNQSGQTLARFDLSSSGPLIMIGPQAWTYTTDRTGASPTSALSSLGSLVIDMGRANPKGAGNVAIAYVTVVQPGQSSSVVLP